MAILRLFSISRAWHDLRRFLRTRKPYELWFLVLSMGVTLLILIAFSIDSHFQKQHHETIIYVQSWPADRTEADILADRKIFAAKQAKEEAALEKRRKERQAEFKRLDNQLKALGL